MGAVADDEPILMNRVNAHIVEENGPAPPEARRSSKLWSKQVNNGDGANDNDPDDDNAGDVAAVTENTIRTSLGRLTGGVLIIPRISSLMGSLVFWLSVQVFSAVAQVPRRAPAFAVGGTRWAVTTGTGLLGVLGPRAVFRGTTLGEMGLLKKLGVAGMLGLSVAGRGTYTWAECDPVSCALSWFCLGFTGGLTWFCFLGIGGKTRWGLGCSPSYVLCSHYCRRRRRRC